MKRFFAASLTIALVFSAVITAAPPAHAIPLSTLMTTDGTIQVGDKLFSDFTGVLSSQVLGGGSTTPFDLSGIDVAANISDTGLFGLRFSGSLNALAPVADSRASLDILIGYTVTVLTPGNLITDIDLRFNGSCTLLIPATGNCVAIVTENASDGLNDIGQAVVIVTDPPPTFDRDSRVDLDEAVARVIITKDINLIAFNGALANISSIDQFVSQTVPEPGTLLLLGLGLGTVGVWSRRRRK